METRKNDEIDLIELIGVVLKWRKVVICFVVIATTLVAAGYLIKELRKHLITPKPKYFAEVKKDILYSSYTFFSYDQRFGNIKTYKEILGPLLFPLEIASVNFDVVNSSTDDYTVYYLFGDKKSMNSFVPKYNEMVDLLDKYKKSRDMLSGFLLESCNKFFSTTTFASPKDLKLFFDDTKDIHKCNQYNYYSNLVSEKLSYAFGTAITMANNSYISFLSDLMKNNSVELTNIHQIGRTINRHNKPFNIKKFIKIVAIATVLSIFMSVLITFLLEFWSINKKRLKEFLK